MIGSMLLILSPGIVHRGDETLLVKPNERLAAISYSAMMRGYQGEFFPDEVVIGSWRDDQEKFERLKLDGSGIPERCSGWNEDDLSRL